jgi:hypothetical protein
VERVVSKAERVSPEDLIAITNSYFDSLSARDGDIIASIQPAHACRIAWGGSLLFITASFPAPGLCQVPWWDFYNGHAEEKLGQRVDAAPKALAGCYAPVSTRFHPATVQNCKRGRNQWHSWNRWNRKINKLRLFNRLPGFNFPRLHQISHLAHIS